MNQQLLDKTFYALSDQARRDILIRLAHTPQTAGALAEPFHISRPAISRHLRVLREVGLVKVDFNGRHREYHLAPNALDDAQLWIDDVQQMWSTALQSLKKFVEENP
jgi:DNA-binding transcriptional ArsR family regulator